MDKSEYRMAYVRAIGIPNQLSCPQIFPERTTISGGSDFQVQNCRYLAKICNFQTVQITNGNGKSPGLPEIEQL
jgi:hypothetical protein